MPKMKPGKYVGHKFTDEQTEARKLWNRANLKQVCLLDALMTSTWGDRHYLHARLDVRIDEIERLRAKAAELFPDVGESFTVASMTIKF